MNLKDFHEKLSEIYDDLKSIADEAVGGFAIDSPHGLDPKKKKKKDRDPLEEEAKFKRVMIDFDKTIYSAKSGWNDGKMEDDPFPDAKKSIDFLKDQGYEIVIFSSRASEGNADMFAHNVEDEIQNIKNYLVNNEIYFDRITGDKIAADFYIDDKAIHIKDGNWKNVISQIKKREKSL